MIHQPTTLKMELYKLFKKKTTYLLCINYLVPIIFGIGMFAQVSFLVSDGTDSFDIISTQGISGLEFINNMMTQAHYITVFILVVISSLAFSGEVECKQIDLYVVRICNRGKIILAKFLALTFLQVLYYMIFSIISLVIYIFFVNQSKYGNGMIYDSNHMQYILSFLIRFLGVMSITALNIFIGMKTKSFPCFAATYIIWFITKYINFFDNIKLFIPDNFAEYILSNKANDFQIVLYAGLFLIYTILSLIISIISFTKKDLK